MAEKKMFTDAEMTEAADLMHQVSNLYVSTKTSQDYGTGEEYSSVEVHLLNAIIDHPGIPPSELADFTGRTRGAVSQNLKKLEDKGLLNRAILTDSPGKVQLCVTEKGLELDRLHRVYDAAHFGETMDIVSRQFSREEIDTTFRVLEGWLRARRGVHKKRMEEQKKASDHGNL